MPGIYSPSLPTLLLLKELTDVLGGHDLSGADSGHNTCTDSHSDGNVLVLIHLSLGGKALQEVLQLAFEVIVSWTHTHTCTQCGGFNQPGWCKALISTGC